MSYSRQVADAAWKGRCIVAPFEGLERTGSGLGNGTRDKTIRVLQMAWLLQKGDQTVDNLAARFGVSRRTIYRDLSVLEKAKLPLVSQHMGKGYRMLAGYPPFLDPPVQRVHGP